MAAATMAATSGGYALLPGTPATAPASPATPPSSTQPGKWVEAPPVAVGTYEKLLARLTLSLHSTLQSRYFYASIVYCFYCTGMLMIDFVGYGKEFNDRLYLFFGVVHLFNAWQYWWAWKGRSWTDPIVFPEYINVLAAALYLWSAALYPTERGPTDGTTIHVHRIETAAAGIEFLACIGWFITWHLTYVRVPGRGYTLDDPDVWALITIFAGSAVYLWYNVEILQNPDWYGTYDLYFVGDILYACNGVLYLLAALRDDGWFWFMPLAGGFPCPAGQALMYRIVYAAEKKQIVQEALAKLEAEERQEKGLASAVVALLAPEGDEEKGQGSGLATT